MRSFVRHVSAVVLAVTAVFGALEYRPQMQTAQSPRMIAPANDVEMRSWNATVSDLLRTGALRESRIEVDALMPGRTHQRMNQMYKGVRVFGGDVVRQLGAGQVISVFGTLYDGIELDVAPGLSPGEARSRVAALSGADTRSIEDPELTVLPLLAGGFALTYRAEAWSASSETMYFLDARTGGVVWQYNNLQTQAAVRPAKGVLNDDKKASMRQSGSRFVAEDLLRPLRIRTYDMLGNLTRTKQILAGTAVLGDVDLANVGSETWVDGASVDGHAYAGWTYDYYFKRFGRKGLDDCDSTVQVIVHPVNRANVFTASSADIGTFYINAVWYTGPKVAMFGEGLPVGTTVGGQAYNYFAGALDVVGHELTHGVTQFTSNLTYLNESGALNKAFSDIMGTSIEFYYQPIRGHANYLCSEDIAPPNGFRSMSNPQSFGDPDHYSRRYVGPDDNGGVHTNSGIANHAFYLAIEGGTNRTSGLSVTGVGAANREQIERVFYRAFTSMLTANATFAIARQATIQAARDLYGSGSNAERAVTQAWTAVGVN